MTEDSPGPQRPPLPADSTLRFPPYGQPQSRRRSTWIWILVFAGFALFIPVVSWHPFRVSNEAWAIQTIHDIAMAETAFNAAYPDTGYACSLAQVRHKVGIPGCFDVSAGDKFFLLNGGV
jgi:hypothetical protein